MLENHSIAERGLDKGHTEGTGGMPLGMPEANNWIEDFLLLY